MGTATAGLEWGAMSNDKFPDESVAIGDRCPWAQESYDASSVDGKKMGVRDMQPYGCDRFVRAEKKTWRFPRRATDLDENPVGPTHYRRRTDYANRIRTCLPFEHLGATGGYEFSLRGRWEGRRTEISTHAAGLGGKG